MRVVVALGGNALSPAAGSGSVEELRVALARTAEPLAELVASGAEVVLTHGNGPQVGRLLLQQQLAAAQVPAMPMDVCGALSQGQLGYLLAQALNNTMRARDLPARVLCLVTQVVVDSQDPAFRQPSKPVGPSYDGTRAQELSYATGHTYQEQSDGAWRRVVASPRPLRLVEEAPLRSLVTSGHIVVAAGGGGVPVVEHQNGLLGVEAVVDKDRTAVLLAKAVQADMLLLLTEVAGVHIGFGTPEAHQLTSLTVSRARELLQAGEFPEGSMGPKVEACADFVAAGGQAAIGSLADATQVLAGRVGTSFLPG